MVLLAKGLNFDVLELHQAPQLVHVSHQDVVFIVVALLEIVQLGLRVATQTVALSGEFPIIECDACNTFAFRAQHH